jgi:diguanylate cyclase (GGDEF)-like protein
MSKNAHNFIAEKLVEVVEDKHRRQQMMVNSFTVFGLVFLIYASIRSYFDEGGTLFYVLTTFAVFSSINVYVMFKKREWGIIGLTSILYSLSYYLLFTGGYENTGVFWVYLLAPIAIFINRFKTGLTLSIGFLITLSSLFISKDMHNILPEFYNDAISSRIVLTLIALSGMCHILIYFQSKVDEYIVKMHEGDIFKLAYFDSLTMLSNRITFRSILYHAVQRATYPSSALIYIDLDNFKSINDEYGHDQGDDVLADFGAALKRIAVKHIGSDKLGQYDVSRLGGDEFAIYVEDATNREIVIALTEDLLTSFNERVIPSLKGIHHELGASIGIVFVSSNERDLLSNMSLADKAMYEAKKAGKGRYNIVEV